MASKYAKPVSIPVDFPDILRDFAREVLRQQGILDTRESIYHFGVDYFREAVAKRDNASSDATKNATNAQRNPAYMTFSEDRIQEIIHDTFKAHFPNDLIQGRLPIDIFKQAIQKIAEQLHLNSFEIDALYADATEQDGELGMSPDLLSVVFQAVLFLRASKQQRAVKAETLDKRYKDVDIFLHGMTQDELESLLREIFQRADQKETAYLSRADFLTCLKDEDLGFSQREINILMAEAPFETEKSAVPYFDFISTCFEKLKQLYHQKIISFPSDQESLAQHLLEAIREYDHEGRKLLRVSDLVHLLMHANLGLTKLQVVALAAEAHEKDHGFIEYENFAAMIAPMALFFVDYECQQQLAEFAGTYRKESRFYTVFEMNQPAFEKKLSVALIDADQSKSGTLYREEMAEAIEASFPDVTGREMRCLMALAGATPKDDEYEYDTVNRYGFRSLQLLQEYDAMIVES